MRRLLAAIFGLLFLGRASAGHKWPSNEAVINAILAIWIPYTTGAFAAFKKFMVDTEQVMTDLKMLAFGKFGDAINKSMEDNYRREAARAAEPPPQACRNKGLADAGNTALTETALRTRTTTLGGDIDTADVTVAAARKRRRYRVLGRVKDPGGTDPNLTAAPLTLPSSTPKDYDPYRYALYLMGATEEHAPRLPRSAEGRRNSVTYEDLRASHLAKLSIVRRALQQTISLRKPSSALYKIAVQTAGNSKAQLDALKVDDGISAIDLLAFEIEQTYGSTTWRSEIDQYADPTPVMKAMAALLSTRSRLMAEIETLHETRNLLLSALTLQRLDSETNRQRLKSAYLAATGESPTIKEGD